MISNSNISLSQLLAYATQQQTAVILHSNNYKHQYARYQTIAGFGIQTQFTHLQQAAASTLALGYIGFDFKNTIYNTTSQNLQLSSFQDFFFFQPQQYYIQHHDGKIENTLNQPLTDSILPQSTKFNWQAGTSIDQYVETINKIKQDIINGVYYEMNYCIHFHSEQTKNQNPYQLFAEINNRTQSPFAAFIKHNNSYLLCFSPERFFTTQEQTILSQPIKGTLKKEPNQTELELAQFSNLEKERAENIMIVDLVRNDLSKLAIPGSVQVTELCKPYTFSHVHHLISTIKAQLPAINHDAIIQALFPMGSMTGAPKLEVLKHIEKYETFKRGIYSGTVGYIRPTHSDFNVVIRSIQLYNQQWHYCVGGAIVFDSEPQSEYQECMAKLNGILRV